MVTVPREAGLEFFLNGWTPITARQASPITMSRGRLDWAGETSPARFDAMLDNSSGDLNPDNPLGDYYGQLNRNTPMRFSYVLLRDTFGRTVTDSWGSTTPDGVTAHATASLPYTLSGTAANFDVGSGAGTMAIATSLTQRRAYLADAVHRLIDVTVDIPTFSAPATGENVQSILLRGTSLTNYVAVDVDVTAAGVVRIAIRDTDDNTYLVAPTTVAGVVRTSPMRLRAQVEGQAIRGKVWNPSGNNEPYNFQAAAVSATVAYSGWIGLRAATGTANTNVTFTFDNLIISSVRFFGTARRISPRSDSTGRNKYAILEGAGVLRRMERNKTSTKTAIQKFVENNATQPLAYWPLDDKGLSLTGRVAAGAGLEAILNFQSTTGPTQNFTPGQAFGSGKLAPYLNDAAKVDHQSFVRCALAAPYIGNWTVHFVVAFTGGRYTDALTYDTMQVGNLATSEWTLKFDSFNQTIEVWRPITGATIATISTALYDDASHVVSLRSTQNGADVDWLLAVDGSTADSGTVTGLTNPELLRAAFATSSEENYRERTVGSVVFYSGTGVSLQGIADAARGHANETAGRRLERLCSENNIAFTYIGDLDATAAMGPQYPIPLLALLRECADTDLGTLVDSRMAPGLLYRTLASLYNQSTGITLDYAAGQLTGSMVLDHDDQDLSNDITVRRVDGGEYRATQTSGPNNVNDPGDDSDGAGTYDTPATVNTATDGQIVDIATWLRWLGTIPEPRVPSITVNPASPNITAALDAALLSLDVDDRVVVQNMTSQDRYTPLDQLGRGYTETLDTIFSNKIDITCAPASPFDVVRLDDAARGKVNVTDSALTTSYNSTATSLSASFTEDRWTTDAAHFPIPITIAGEDMTLTAVSGTTSPQTLTVTRNTLTAKNLPANSPVRLTRRATVAR